MAAPFDSNAADKSRIEAHDFPSDETNKKLQVGESSSSSSSSSGSSTLFWWKESNDDPMREYWKREMMKLKSPLPPRQPPKSTTSPPQKSRLSLTLDRAIEHELIHGRQLDPNLDPKALRRTISNRISAQRSRMKRTLYVIDLEKKVHELEELVSTLTPKFEAFKEKKRILQLENDSLRNQVDIRAAEARIKEDGLDEKRRELEELKESLNYKNIIEGQPSNSNSEVEMLHVSGSDPKPYTIEFYQERLMQLEMKQFINQELKNRSLAVLAPPHPQQGSLINDDDDIEIDQYLNLDEMDIQPDDV